MDRFFKISERGSSFGKEIIGGLTTFLAMAYIIAVNPGILVDAGIPFNAALTATCFGAAIMTLAMGLFSNRPLALASGMGINSIIAYTICMGANAVDWRVAMAIVLLEGVVILVLVLCGLRKAIMDAIPSSLRHAIGIGIGLFIAFIGLKGGGLIVANDATILGFGSVTSPVCQLALLSIVLSIVLRVRGT
jgi:AGZA family xanthine/uracil permease-like MFS transporter